MGKTSNGKSIFYFMHKAQSRNDVKILQLDEYLGEHIGYALFFKALELMAELPEPYIDKNSKLHRKALGLDIAEYENFIDKAISSGLFEVTNEELVYSPGFIKWLGKKDHAKEAGSKGGKITQAKRKAESEAPALESATSKTPSKPKPKPEPISKARTFKGCVGM